MVDTSLEASGLAPMGRLAAMAGVPRPEPLPGDLPWLMDMANGRIKTLSGGPGVPYWERMTLLPFEKNVWTGELRPAVPQVIMDLMDGLMAPGKALRGEYDLTVDDKGRVSFDGMAEDTANLAGLLTLGPGAPGGVVAAGGAGGALRSLTGKLPMDTASRMARAKEMGFFPDMPLYHGTDTPFSAFDPSLNGRTTGGASQHRGAAWVALEPETANEFAELAAKKGAGSGSAQIYPLLHRAEKPGVVVLDGSETNLEISATLEEAFDAGYDAVMLRNYTTPSGETGRNVLVVRDANQLRSPWAAFDPAKRDSPDLLSDAGGIVPDSNQRVA